VRDQASAGPLVWADRLALGKLAVLAGKMAPASAFSLEGSRAK
jgi:hypothetical protein